MAQEVRSSLDFKGVNHFCCTLCPLKLIFSSQCSGRPDMAPFKFIDRVSRGVELQKFGDGSSSRDYTYIDDIVDGVIRSLDRQHKYEVFNLGKGNGTSLNEFISLVEKHTGKKAIIRQLPDQAGDVPYTCADVSKAFSLLGYKARVSFEEGIRRTAKWYGEAHTLKTASEVEKEKHVVSTSHVVQSAQEQAAPLCA